MKVFKFANGSSFTNDLSEIKGMAEFDKVKKGKWYHCQRICVIKSNDGNFGLVSMTYCERLANLFKINPFKKVFEGKSITILKEHKVNNCSNTVLKTNAKPDRFSPAIKDFISLILAETTQQAKMFVAIGSKGYELLLRKADKSPLDDPFVSSQIAEQLKDEDLKNLKAENIAYNLWVKTMDGNSHNFIWQANQFHHEENPNDFQFMTKDGDFVLNCLNSDEIVKNLNRLFK